MIWLNEELEQSEGASTPNSSSQLSVISGLLHKWSIHLKSYKQKILFFLPWMLLSFLLQQQQDL